MDPCSAETLFAQVDVSEVWGVGRQNYKKLNAMGVRSVLVLINANPKEIKKQFSICTALCGQSSKAYVRRWLNLQDDWDVSSNQSL